MTITLNNGFIFSSNVIKALADAGGFRFQDGWKKNTETKGKTWRAGLTRQIFCSGHTFTSPKQFGEWMLSEINGWMADNGMVKIDTLRQANSRGYFYFTVD